MSCSKTKQFEGTTEMIDFGSIKNEIDPACWTLDFGIPEGIQRVTVVLDHGERRVYVDGEPYLTIPRRTKNHA